MLNRETRWLVAALQAVIGFEWLVSGADKVLAGTFPQGLAGALNDGINGNPNLWYVGVLRAAVLPHSVLFGYLIEGAEVVVGAVLVAGALLLLGQVRRPGDPQHRLEVRLLGAVAIAALICAFLCVNFHFWMGDGLIPGLDPSRPYNEGIDLDTLMPPIALIVAAANLRMREELTGFTLTARAKSLLARVSAALHPAHGVTATVAMPRPRDAATS